MSIGSSRPYLIRALYAWIIDGDEDPYVEVDAIYPNVKLPLNRVSNGYIILNLSPRAVNKFVMGKSAVSFTTRFSGVNTQIILPYGSISAIFSKTTGVGMRFGQEPGGVPDQKNRLDVEDIQFNSDSQDVDKEFSKPYQNIGKRASLRLIKSD
tara:strand:- start:214 stop:672 length:459 start_codon:yes stop_codon:yes gene_type:complete